VFKSCVSFEKWFSQEILLELVEKQQIIVCFNKPSTVNTFYNHDLGDQFLCDTNCRTPTLAKCGGEAQHLEELGLGVLRDSRMFRAQQQGAKHLALGCSWCHWKGLET